MRNTKKIFPILFAGITLMIGIINSCNNDDDQKPKSEKINLKIGKLPLELKIGDKITLKANDKDEGKFTWKTTDSKIVTVDDKGTITAVAAGEAEVTAKSSIDIGSIEISWQVTVKEHSTEKPTPSTKAAMTPEGELMLKLQVGQTADISVEVEGSEGQEVTYSSSNEKVATVDDEGMLTANGAGEAEITVATKNGVKQKLKVIVWSEKDGIITRLVKNFYAPVLHGEGSDDWSKQLDPSNIDYYTKFDFFTGKEVEKDSPDWDIAIAGTYIIVNGGQKKANNEPERKGNAAAAILSDTTFEGVTDVKDVQWKQDTSNNHAISDDQMSKTKGWCYYDMSKHLIHPIPGRILVFRTRDGKYAKIQIVSFYKGIVEQEKIPAGSHDFNYYTFKYAYNKNGGTKLGWQSGKSEEKKAETTEPTKTPHRTYREVAGNLLKNGGFEEPIDTVDWKFNKEAFEVTTTDAHGGEKSLHFYKPIEHEALSSKWLKMNAGNYRASFYAKVMNNTTILSGISFGTGSFGFSRGSELYYGWRLYTRDFEVKTNEQDKNMYRLYLEAKPKDDTKPVSVYFDDASLIRLAKVHFVNRVSVAKEGTDKSVEVKLALEYPALEPITVRLYLHQTIPGVHFDGTTYSYKNITFSKGSKITSFKLNIDDDKVYRSDREYSFTISSRGSVVTDGKDFILKVIDDEQKLPEKLVTIPDEHFRNYLKEKFPDAFPGGGDQMNANYYMIVGTEKLSVRDQNIESLEGIEHFISLSSLNCINNNLTSLDVSKNKNLTVLFCDNNKLTSLNISQNTKLTTLYCTKNLFKTLNLSYKNLKLLKCTDNNQLTSLDVHGCRNLTTLYCYRDKLTNLNVHGCSNLNRLWCSDNPFTSLDLSQNPNLNDLQLPTPSLTTLKIREKALGVDKIKNVLIQAKNANPSLVIKVWAYASSKGGYYEKCADYDISKGVCKPTTKAEKSTTETSTKTAKTFSIANTSLTATAYKFFKREERVGVPIHFNNIQTGALHNPATDELKALKGMTFKFAVSSLTTGDTGRDQNILNYFFKKLTTTDSVTGTFGTFNESTKKGTISLTMNGGTKDMTVSFTKTGNSLSFEGTCNAWEWGNQGVFFTALASLTKACKLVHSKDGDPKHAKTWPDVDIKGSITFSD